MKNAKLDLKTYYFGNEIKERLAKAGFEYDGHVTHASLEAQWKVFIAEIAKLEENICQTLGKVLGYPWYKDDLKNFPDATEGDGVCVGDHTAESIAREAANRIYRLQK